MTSNEQLVEFYREFILSLIDTGDLDLFLDTMKEEVFGAQGGGWGSCLAHSLS